MNRKQGLLPATYNIPPSIINPVFDLRDRAVGVPINVTRTLNTSWNYTKAYLPGGTPHSRFRVCLYISRFYEPIYIQTATRKLYNRRSLFQYHFRSG